ncbi:kinase-like domain-containing protein [Roridomyces roridus]|uniref:Kinase-like domain-containing protein n=1 Tax=Roridomyces roridus TaxID=1738132 RepID=A0AAD7FRN2_9AGAR|nr:kinase-like domain-containing protein [Roridomyces roridus]
MSEKYNKTLHEKEAFWFQRRAFLEKAGYELRPKFNLDFVGPKRHGDEHTVQHPRKHIMDAERISDGQQVMLKWVSRKAHPCEVDVGCFFSSPTLSGSSKNHCVPILEVLQDPRDDDKEIIVMPRLIRFDEPIFDTVGEVIDCWRQIFEGVQFMHDNYVAHRDISLLNILQDPTKLYPRGFHPVNYCFNPTNDGLAYSITRTECWPRYYLIDFGLSRRYDPSKGPPLERVSPGGSLNPPEYSSTTECNPFPADIWCLGSLLKRHFLGSDPKQHMPLQFLKPLVEDMTNKNPASRPTIGEVIQRFNKQCENLTQWQLRKPGQPMDMNGWIDQIFRRLKNTIKSVPALPFVPTLPMRQLNPRMRSFYTKTPRNSMDSEKSRKKSM